MGRGIKGEGSSLTASNRQPKVQHAQDEPTAPASAASPSCGLLDTSGAAWLRHSLYR